MGRGTSPFNDLRAASQTYEFDHFSGSQIGIYIGDVFIDEIARVEFNVHQAKKPIYGYASQYYDAMASGQVLVSGSFAINFKESGYMHIILKRYLESIQASGLDLGTGEVTPLGEPRVRNSKVLRQNIERILETQNKEGPKTEPTGSGTASDLNPADQFDEFSFYDDLAALEDTEFENIAEVFEDAIWQDTSTDREDLGNVIRPASLKLDSELRRADQFPGFTIWIAYGDINNPLANHTIKKLTGVHIVSTGQAIEINGEPVMEQYEFLARNVL